MAKKRPIEIADDLDALDFDESHEIKDLDVDFDSGKDGVLIYNGKKYATNLLWLTANDIDEQKSINEKAKLLNADFYCNRFFVQQNGFGKLGYGHRMGMPAIAAMAADALVGEWHGVFKADNGWLYVAVHSDNIAPDGDIFFDDEEEAYNHTVLQAENYKWPKTYVPEKWNLRQNDGEIELDRIVGDIANVTLKPASLNGLFGGAANKSLAVMVLLGLLAFVFITLVSPSIFSQLVPDRKNVASENIEISEILATPPREPVVRENPLELLLQTAKLIDPTLNLSRCIESFDELMISIPGWELAIMRCRGNFVEASWRKMNGTLETLRQNISELPIGVSKTYGANSTFLASKIIPNLQEDVPLELLTREVALIRIYNQFGDIGSLAIKDVLPKTVPNQSSRTRINNPQDADAPVKPLTLNDIPALNGTIKTVASPFELKQNFNIQGLKFNFIEWNFQSGQWTYDFTVYLIPEDFKQ